MTVARAGNRDYHGLQRQGADGPAGRGEGGPPGAGRPAAARWPTPPRRRAPTRTRRSASATKFVKFTRHGEHPAADRAARPVHRQAAAGRPCPSGEVQPALDMVREPLPRRGHEPRGADRRLAHDHRRGGQRTRRLSATAARAARPAGGTTSPTRPGGRSGRRSAPSGEAHPEIYALGGDLAQEPVPQPHPPGGERPVRRGRRVPRQRRRDLRSRWPRGRSPARAASSWARR